MHREMVSEKQQSTAGYRHWQSLSNGFLVCLAIVGPTFLFEELWRGQPMIDQGGADWLWPAAIIGLGYFIGGRVAGRNRSTLTGAFNQGLLVAALTLGMTFVADVIRRIILSEAPTFKVLAIWIASAAGALIMGGLGGINGRRATRRAQRRYQMERFH
ncbi:MAG TPA: hypothetical protein VGG38_20655 [Acidimicrobiales bacterium]|jgi:hypothetical protein